MRWSWDVADPRDVEEMIGRACATSGWVVLTASPTTSASPDRGGSPAATPEAWDATFDVNLPPAMLTARAALPIIEPGSSLVFISSIAASEAHRPARGLRDVESGARGAHVARRHGGQGPLHPGERRDAGAHRHRLGSERANDATGRTAIPVPLGRHGTAWEVAYAALFLLSHESAYVTGQTLALDGGRTTL